LNTQSDTRLYSVAGVRSLDRLAIERHGIPGLTLMQRAGAAAWRLAASRWPGAGRIVIVCGTGNNGGDGYVLALEAHRSGREVTVAQLGDPESMRGDARACADAARTAGLHAVTFESSVLEAKDLVVDAMLGTGVGREVREEWRVAIETVNARACPCLAIDVPSGLDADSGRVMGAAVRADATLTFIGRKLGLYTGAGPEHCGTIYFADLDLPPRIYEEVPPAAALLDAEDLLPMFPRRHRGAHKGDFGHVLVIGGDLGFAGAVRLAGEAAARIGGGLVSIATRSAHAAMVSAMRPELMAHGIESRAALAAVAERATVLAIGPGLGQTSWAEDLFGAALDLDLPKVVDADGLNLLAHDPAHRRDWVLTPHPGEAARLLGCRSRDVQADRFAAARELQARYGGVCVLKGSGTLVADDAALPGVCPAGNPGMASGGMGDVLTGVLAGLLAQGLDLGMAARLGVLLHAMAGDRAARDGERGMLATDLLPHLRALVNPSGE
jgi:NAD(P)H-hydrate epimerase